MRKNILLSLLFTTTSLLYGMDEPNPALPCADPTSVKAVFNSNDLLSCITNQVCISSNWNAYDIGKMIRTLVLVDKHFFAYFSQYYIDDNWAKNIIKKIALHSGKSDHAVAVNFGHKKIANEIDRLFYIAANGEKQFMQDDLKDQWYLNATGWCTCEDKRHSTLLLATLKSYNIGNAKKLLNAGINLTTAGGANPIQFMAQTDYSQLARKEKEGFFALARLFIAKGIHPDSRFSVTCPTLLHRAVIHNNQHFAYSLLKAGADPYKLLVVLPQHLEEQLKILIEEQQLRKYDPEHPSERNAFYIYGTHVNWLKDLVDKVEAEKSAPASKKRKKINHKPHKSLK